MQFRDFDGYRNDMSASNISEGERNQSFWGWVEEYPASLKNILGRKEFQAYLSWESEWVEQQNLIWENDLSHIRSILNICARNYASPIQKVFVILNPIKCAYSADYHLDGNQLFYCSGAFNSESVVHKFLHHVVHPFISECKEAILQCHVLYPDIDNSYYLTGDEYGKMNAFKK